jgi:hypothetical protein
MCVLDMSCFMGECVVWVGVCIGHVTFHRWVCVSICRVSWASVMWVLDMSHLTSECVVWVSVCVGYAMLDG